MRRRFSASGPWFQALTKAVPTTGSPVGRDACGLGGSGGLVWRGVGAPPYGPGQTCAVGAASSRPKRPPFPAVPPLNAVGRHALMPPWPGPVDRKPDGSAGAVRAAASRPYDGIAGGRDACGLGGPGGLIWRGVGTPSYGPGQTCAVGAASSRPKRPPFPAVSPLNAVGRHALMPSWPGPVDRKPDGSAGAVRAAISRPWPATGTTGARNTSHLVPGGC